MRFIYSLLLIAACTPQQPADRILGAIERAKQACVLYENVPDIPRDARVDEACRGLMRVDVLPVPDAGTEALVPPS